MWLTDFQARHTLGLGRSLLRLLSVRLRLTFYAHGRVLLCQYIDTCPHFCCDAVLGNCLCACQVCEELRSA